MKKILGEYARFESLKEYHAPEFRSNATEFHITLWNLNYGTDIVKDVADNASDVVKESTPFTKDFTKEFTKAQRRIYRLISMNPKVNIDTIAEELSFLHGRSRHISSALPTCTLSPVKADAKTASGRFSTKTTMTSLNGYETQHR